MGVHPLHRFHLKESQECSIVKTYVPSNQEVRELNFAYSLHNISDLDKRKQELIELTFSNEMVEKLYVINGKNFNK